MPYLDDRTVYKDWLVGLVRPAHLVSNVLMISRECQFWRLTLAQSELAERI